MKIFLQFGLFILLAHSMSVFSSEPFPVDSSELEKLFEPVDPSLQDQLFKENQFSLKRATYFGKRYRSVKVNLDLLAPNGKAFVVNPFDDVEFIVSTAEIKNYDGGLSQRWVGNMLKPHLDLEDVDIPAELKTQLNTMGINITPMRVRRRAGDSEISGEVGISPDSTEEIAKNSIYITGRFPEYGIRYRLLPVDQVANYHLIIELDHSKQLINGTSDEAKRRREEHTIFREALEAEEKRMEKQKQGGLK